MGMVKPWFGKSKKFYTKKMDKADKIIAKQEAVKLVCQLELDKLDNKTI